MDSSEGDIQSPFSLHEYMYSDDDSANVLDPSGHDGIDELMGSFSISSTINAMSIFSALPLREFNLVVNWKNQFFWRDVSLLHSKQKDFPLAAAETSTIKQAALESAQAAFAAFPTIHVLDGGESRDVFNVVDGTEMGNDGLSLGSTSPYCVWKGPCPDTKIFYEQHLIDAQEVTQDSRGHNTQTRADYIPAIGRGIGRTIAHEFGHRYGLNFMHEGPANEFQSGAQKVENNGPWFGVPDLKWGDKVFEEIRRLTANRSPY
jgi:hypothetical protein